MQVIGAAIMTFITSCSSSKIQWDHGIQSLSGTATNVVI